MPDVHIRLHKNIFWLILDRPPLNNLTVGMLDQLTTAMRKAVRQSPRLVLVTGTSEHAFCAGVDLPDDADVHRAELLRGAGDVCAAFGELRTHHISTVALIKGNAFGAGCELAALCDTLIAHEHATFRLPAVNAKVFPCAVSTYLPASIGQEATTRLMQNGETLTAAEAMRLGLAHQVLSSHRFLLDAQELLVMLAESRVLTKER